MAIDPGGSLAPVQASERIATLDVIRGFALLGIAVMNVEWFNRPLLELGVGIPAGRFADGVDYWIAWLVHTFVRGKFWTIFSILFGMGFAVMLMRAREAGRDFMRPYVRRTLALAGFGLLHGILVWAGDILLSYATAAALLLLVLFGRLWHGLVAALLVVAVGLAMKSQAWGSFLALLVVVGLVAVYLRSERDVMLFGRPWHVLSLSLLALGALLLVGGGVGIAVAGPEKGIGIAFGGAMLVLLGWLSQRYRDPEGARLARVGATLYLALFVAGAIGSGLSMLQPQAERPKPTAEQQLKIDERRAERRKEIARETQVMRSGTYAEAVAFRRTQFLGDYAQNGFFAMMVLGLFMLGAWFVQSGRIVHPDRYLGFYRRLATIGLPFGIALALASSALAVTYLPGVNDVRWQLAVGIQMIGNLPMALGYMAIVVLLLQRPAWGRVLSWFAPAGRMALTNYIAQSVLGTLVFYGYGLGHWGAPRAWQLAYVLVVLAAQMLLSRRWLSRFRYGPLEWVWRWITYARRPAMRLA